ncbi:hypothetical protein AAZX31_18G014100 [Glycine max]
MGLVFTKLACAFLLCYYLITSEVYSVVSCVVLNGLASFVIVEGLLDGSKARDVNLGGWLVIEGWIKPSLFGGTANGDMLHGTSQVQFKSGTLQKYVSAENGGEMNNLTICVFIIVIASTACVIMFLITLSKILSYYYARRYNVSRSNPPILFDIRGDFPFSDDEEQEQAIRHPIWFIPTEGLQQSIIDSITVCKYRKDEGLAKETLTECLVCLGEFQQEESLRVLPKCNHAFHISCIDTWLRSHKSCPLCRAPIVLDAASLCDINQDIEESI